MEKARKRVNSFIKARVCEAGVAIIHYPDILSHPQFFQGDGAISLDLAAKFNETQYKEGSSQSLTVQYRCIPRLHAYNSPLNGARLF